MVSAGWLAAGIREPNAMTLATADKRGHPSARIVLLKDVGERGFTFFTNYESRKGHDLTANPHASLVLFWPELERQICIAGSVSKVSRAESKKYFDSRPKGSQAGSLRFQPERNHRRPLDNGEKAPYSGGKTPRRRRAASPLLGRFLRRARPHRVLARPPEPPA